MKGLLAFSFTLLFSSQVAGAPATDQQQILTTCSRVVIAANTMFNSSPKVQARLRNDLRVHIDEYARGLSESLPQMYNSVHTGLKTVLEMPPPTNVHSAPSSDRAAIIGLWCVQDTVDAMNKSSRPLLQEQETQVEIINLYSKLVDKNGTN